MVCILFNAGMQDMIYIDRTLEPVIERASRRFKVVAVTGMRQVGKSTLLRHMAENRRAYVTLDDRIPLDLALDAGEVFLKQYPPPLLIDEIQRAPGLCLEIKSWVDRFPTCSSRRPRGHSSTVEPFRRRKVSRRTDRFEKS